MATTAAPAGAGTTKPCVQRSVTTPFVPWNDTSWYFPAPSGTFESGIGSWVATGNAWTGLGNEPWKVNGSSHLYSLTLMPKSQVVSKPFCVQSDEESVRLFVKLPGVIGSALEVTVTATSSVGTAATTVLIAGDASGWCAGPRIGIPDRRDANGQQTVTIGFRPVSTDATFQVDDVMVDPWRYK